MDNTIVFFGSARPKPLDIANSELEQFLSALPEPKKRTQEQTVQLSKLEAIARLSKYYDQAVELSAKLSKWSEITLPIRNILFALEVAQG